MRIKTRTILATLLLTFAAISGSAMASPQNTEESPQKYFNNNGFSNLNNIVNNQDYSKKSLNNESTRKVTDLLINRKNGELAPNTLYIGGKSELHATRKKSLYIIDSLEKIDARLELPCTQLLLTSTLGEYFSGSMEFQISDVISNLSNSSIKMPTAYFSMGNLKNFPGYIFGCRKIVSFGSLKSSDLYTSSLSRTYFTSYGDQIGLGYNSDGLNIIATFIGKFDSPFDSFINVYNTPGYALNIFYDGKIKDLDYHLGVGYANTTNFNSSIKKQEKENLSVGAISLNSGVSIKKLSLSGEFLVTTHSVSSWSPSVGNELFGNYADFSGLIDFTSDSLNLIKAWNLESSYIFKIGDKDFIPYASYSHILQNSENNLYKIELGSKYNLFDTVWLSAGYSHSSGKDKGTQSSVDNAIAISTTVYF